MIKNSMNEMNATIQSLEIKLSKYENHVKNYEGIESKMEQLIDNNKTLQENLSELRHRCSSYLPNYRSKLWTKKLSNQEIISILKNEIKEVHGRYGNFEKNFKTVLNKLDSIKSIPKPEESETICPAEDNEQPNVVIFHDSLCKKLILRY